MVRVDTRDLGVWWGDSLPQEVTLSILLNPLSQSFTEGTFPLPLLPDRGLTSRLANPSPLGLMGFGATTFILSMYNVQARGITTPNVVMGMALGYGGLVQLIAGIEEFVCGNTFAATAFSSYGGFWLSFASTYIFLPLPNRLSKVRSDWVAFYIPSFGVTTAYETAGELDSALAIYLSAWGIVTLIFFIVCPLTVLWTPPDESGITTIKYRPDLLVLLP